MIDPPRRSIIAAMLSSTLAPGFARAAPERKPIGSLEPVASFSPDEPAGIAVSRTGRIFVTFPKHYGPVAFTVGEVKSGHAVAYPSIELNRTAMDRPAETLFSAQNIRMWVEAAALPGPARCPGC